VIPTVTGLDNTSFMASKINEVEIEAGLDTENLSPSQLKLLAELCSTTTLIV